MEGILSGGSSGMRAKAWFWFLVMLVIPTSTLAFVVGARSVWEGILGTRLKRCEQQGGPWVGLALRLKTSEALFQRKAHICTTKL